MATQRERSCTEAQLNEVAAYVFAGLQVKHGVSFSKPIVDGCTENTVIAVKENIFAKAK